MNNLISRLLSVGALSGALLLGASAQDVSQEYDLDAVEVLGIRPGQLTPVTKQTIKLPELKLHTTAWDVPTLLRGTPSLMITQDAGTMGGYTGFSIRGVDPSRVNITVNGVPVNDSESQAVFWANMPDFGSRLSDIVIVRGAGSSTFGAGAFGATMDMRIAIPEAEAGGSVSTYWGSYGMRRDMVHLASGILGSGWRLNGSLSRTSSNGYIDRSGSKGLSYLMQAYYGGDNYSLQLIHHLGDQQTQVAWNGISPENMEKLGRTYNSAGLMNPDEKDVAKQKFYPDQNDNYKQGHTYLIFKHHPSDRFSYDVTLHYTRGFGYTREFRTGRKYKEYYLIQPGEDNKVSLIREKYLDNHFLGGIVNGLWTLDKGRINAGLSVNRYWGDHYGILPWVDGYKVGQEAVFGPYYPDAEYYRNSSAVLDLSAYVKGEWDFTSTLMGYLDLMYRYVGTTMTGLSDKPSDKTGKMDILDYNGDNAPRYNFILPKVGLNFHPSRHHSYYISYATAAKEPNRKMFTESRTYDKDGNLVLPRPEYMGDLEIGTEQRWGSVGLFVNGYFMHYKDQIVPNGQKSDVGENLMINVPKSYRLGVEMGADWQALPQLRLAANITLSRNRIQDYTFYETMYDTEWNKTPTEVHETSVPIADAPSIISNQSITWTPIKNLMIDLTGNYVGDRYLDNSGLAERKIKGYYLANLTINYGIELPKGQRIDLQGQAINLLNTQYSTYGGAEGYFSKDEQGKVTRSAWTWFYPAAPIHFVAGATYTF